VILYPLINGTRYDFSSVEITIEAVLFNGVKEISYSDGLEPGELRGNHAQLIGRTRGKYSAEGSITFFKEEFQQFIAALAFKGLGSMEASWNASVVYSEIGGAPLMDQLFGCRIKKAEDSGSEGGDALAVKCDLHIMQVIRNHILPMKASKYFR